ncbi:MAG: exodeoxyribonuclease VII large subunit [Sporocytophaga sp.]|nr:exodeoxyribonuclease VII large subunit [Sporocytophaga sp.]
MPKLIYDKNVFSLLEVTKSIQKTLSERYKNAFWVMAEMNKLNHYKHSGHCYPELVEKQDGKVIAQLKSILWKTDYLNANDKFLKVLKEPLKDGIKILFLAKICFDPGYGLALNILEIDPHYTLGDLEREKKETIQKLQHEGIYDQNKTLKLPLLPQRLAIISVETSKGYADFMKVIKENSWNYKFFTVLFPALLQGEKAIEDIIRQLRRIKTVISHFDAVAIIRGGGGDVGLSCYNNYSLAKEIALFPIPVLTGIGHATNETVAEMISYSNQITPTKLAEFLLQKFHNFSIPVQKAEDKIKDKSLRMIMDEKARFHSASRLFRSVANNSINKFNNAIVNESKSLSHHSFYIIKKENLCLKTVTADMRKDSKVLLRQSLLLLSQNKKEIVKSLPGFIESKSQELKNIEKNINNMSPESVLKRGYSITLYNGKALKSVDKLKKGDLIQTRIIDGVIDSNIKSIDQSDKDA